MAMLSVVVFSYRRHRRQYAGRLRREHAGKPDVRIIDFVVAGHPALLRMWDKRQRGYRAIGHRIAEAQTVMQVMPQSIHPNAP
jgi:superfamily II DNA or RNA helicase